MAGFEISGDCYGKFQGAAEAFAANFASGEDIGASFCVSVEGEIVVDLWGGFADEAKTKPWERDTIVNVYSTTKTMMALTALMLADRGVIDLDAPVARYWPEFSANGKSEVRVSHLLSHSAGLSGFAVPWKPEDLYDHDRTCAQLAAQEPWWAPGSAPGYHAVTQGHLVGEVVRRATGKTLGTVFREEIAGPLGADFHIGLDPAHDHRVGELIPPPKNPNAPARDPATISGRTLNNPAMTALEPRTRAWRAAEIPAAGGIGNARSVCTVQSVMANGGAGLNGKRILSEAGAMRARTPQLEGTDLVLGLPIKYGLGYGLPTRGVPFPEGSFYWGGWGGSLVLIWPEKRTCITYVMNRMGDGTMGDLRAFMCLMPVVSALN